MKAVLLLCHIYPCCWLVLLKRVTCQKSRLKSQCANQIQFQDYAIPSMLSTNKDLIISEKLKRFGSGSIELHSVEVCEVGPNLN